MPHHLSADQVSFFHENGYLAIDQLLADEDLQPLEHEYAAVLDEVANRLAAEGQISRSYRDLPFGDRFSAVIREYPALHYHFNISLPLANPPINEQTFFAHFGPAVFGLLRNERILDVVESILGPEISSNPVQQMRMKPPAQGLSLESSEHSNIGTTTWHQDIVALLDEAENSDILTVWVAITDATVQNGCLVTVPKSHRLGEVAHCPGKVFRAEMHVPQSIIREHTAVPLPVKRGGIILFHKQNMHCSLNNKSDHMRWSVDLRYNVTGQPTGRPAYPGFVARSRADRGRELRDPDQWKQMWLDARQRILDGSYTGKLFETEKWDRSGSSQICA